uniref:Envelope glycoprotein gM n=1 Tax=Otarine gammaherpesvirus 4 TaxID=2801541 RepID=A0A889IW09_9GAMA|nr:Envelope glycoprotein gM [Otarine gammaherpesvirus 4]
MSSDYCYVFVGIMATQTLGTKSSKNDTFVYGIWLKLLAIHITVFLCSIVVPIAAMFPNLGFPCYFNALVDYSEMKLSEHNVAQHLTPTLFLESPEMFSYLTYSFIADCTSVCYYILGAIGVSRAHKYVDGLMTLSQWIRAVSSPSVVYMGMLRMWMLQLYVHTLSYKHIYLATFVYTGHFLISIVHIQCFTSRMEALWSQRNTDRSLPHGSLLQRVVKYGRPLTINLQLACLALDMLVFSLTFMMAIGNSFYVRVGDIVIATINLYLGITVLWYICTELWLHKHLPLQVGFYVGVLAGSIILLLPVIRYDSIFMAANLHKFVAINIPIIPTLAIAALLVRVVRMRTWSNNTEYEPLNESNTEGKLMKNKAFSEPTTLPMSHKQYNNLRANDTAVLAGETDDDSDESIF